MNKGFLFALVIVGVGVFVYFFVFFKPKTATTLPKGDSNVENPLTLASPDVLSGDQIARKYTCDGVNVNPTLEISNAPEGVKSLALIVDDPTASNFTHWLVWNIRPDTAEIAEDSKPFASVVGLNDFGKNNYSGPCPPSGIHDYYFRLFALDTMLDLSSDSKRNALLSAMDGHIVSQTQLIASYGR